MATTQLTQVNFDSHSLEVMLVLHFCFKVYSFQKTKKNPFLTQNHDCNPHESSPFPRICSEEEEQLNVEEESSACVS
jgi:hypothetical protein